MGSIAKFEKFMIGVFIIALLLWVVGSFIGVDATLTALSHYLYYLLQAC